MKLFPAFLTASFAIAALTFASLSLVSAQDAGGDAPKKEEKPAQQEPKDDTKKEEGEKDASGDAEKEGDTDTEAKDGEKKDDAKEADDEETYDIPANFEKLMKSMGINKRILKKSLRDKNDDRIKSSADKIRFYAEHLLEKDTDKKRKEAKDYKEWTQELEDNARALRKLVEEKKIDWDDVEEAFDALDKTCDSCHDVYGEE